MRLSVDRLVSTPDGNSPAIGGPDEDAFGKCLTADLVVLLQTLRQSVRTPYVPSLSPSIS